MPRPLLEEVVVADDAPTWEALGFAVHGGAIALDGVTLRLAGTGANRGIVGWRVRGLEGAALDGLPAPAEGGEPPGPAATHPNGATALDTVVAMTGDFDRTRAALRGAGLEPRRIREMPGGKGRQAFYVLGPALLELVGPAEGYDAAGFWGLVVVIGDLDALAARLGDRLGTVRDAVQPGRRIATLRSSAGVSTAVAFMSPR